jgi:hypothetical protein
MGDPTNSSIGADGFRFYEWDYLDGREPARVLSVTSIRKLAGEPFRLVNWQLANILDVALGTQKRTVIGPRGGVSEKRLKDQYPSEFVERYLATEGRQDGIDDLRKWTRAQADSPRNIAAIRGSIVHAAIERDIPSDRIERPWVEAEFATMSKRERDKAQGTVSDEDIHFIHNSVRQYEAMRKQVDFHLIARELQCWNLTAGYAGTFDALMWVPDLTWDRTPPPKGNLFTYQWVIDHGGRLVLGDWKTSKDVFTEHVIQLHAYMAAEFVGNNGLVDARLTELLNATHLGGLFHIRPNQWGYHQFDYSEDVARAFLGSVAFARFLAMNPEPTFSHEQFGSAE